MIRLNKPSYDGKRFEVGGQIRFVDLFFPDGSTPSDRILDTFLKIVDDDVADAAEVAATTPAGGGAVAVHCKAGLGRTGTLIAAWMMKEFRFTAGEAIGWLRTCRPGSVIGCQQHWLEDQQKVLWARGESEKKKRGERKVAAASDAVAATAVVASTAAASKTNAKYADSAVAKFSSTSTSYQHQNGILKQRSIDSGIDSQASSVVAAATAVEAPEKEVKSTSSEKKGSSLKDWALAELSGKSNQLKLSLDRSETATAASKVTVLNKAEKAERYNHDEHLFTQGDKLNLLKARRIKEATAAASSQEKSSVAATSGESKKSAAADSPTLPRSKTGLTQLMHQRRPSLPSMTLLQNELPQQQQYVGAAAARSPSFDRARRPSGKAVDTRPRIKDVNPDTDSESSGAPSATPTMNNCVSYDTPTTGLRSRHVSGVGMATAIEKTKCSALETTTAATIAPKTAAIVSTAVKAAKKTPPSTEKASHDLTDWRNLTLLSRARRNSLTRFDFSRQPLSLQPQTPHHATPTALPTSSPTPPPRAASAQPPRKSVAAAATTAESTAATGAAVTTAGFAATLGRPNTAFARPPSGRKTPQPTAQNTLARLLLTATSDPPASVLRGGGLNGYGSGALGGGPGYAGYGDRAGGGGAAAAAARYSPSPYRTPEIRRKSSFSGPSGVLSAAGLQLRSTNGTVLF